MDIYKRYKVAILGDLSVGKSSIITRFVHDKFEDFVSSTIGAAFISKKINIDDKIIKLDFWDTAGQERYRSLIPMYYRDAAVVIIVYDITSMDSFDNAKIWASEVSREKIPEKCIIVIVGNKSDNSTNRKIDFEEASSYAKSMDFIHAEVSAKTGDGIVQLFNSIGEILLPSSLQIPKDSKIFLEKKKNNSWCF